MRDRCFDYVVWRLVLFTVGIVGVLLDFPLFSSGTTVGMFRVLSAESTPQTGILQRVSGFNEKNLLSLCDLVGRQKQRLWEIYHGED